MKKFKRCKCCGWFYTPQEYENQKSSEGICQPCVKDFVEWRQRILKGGQDDVQTVPGRT